MGSFNYKFNIEDYPVKLSHKFDENKLGDYLNGKLAVSYTHLRAHETLR